MSYFSHFEPQTQACQAINRAESTNWVQDPLFAPKPWDSVFFEDSTLSPPAETAYAVGHLPPASLSTNLPLTPPASIPDALHPALPSTDWQPEDESQILPAADIQALCRAMGYDVPDFAAMPPVPYPLKPTTSDPAGFAPAHTENSAPAGFDPAGSTPVGSVHALTDNVTPAGLSRTGSTPAAFDPSALSPTGFAPGPIHNFAPMANPAPYPVEPPRAEPVSAALSRRRKAQRQLEAILEGREVPVNHKRGRKALPLGAPKAKYTKRVPGAPKPPAQPKRTCNRQIPGPADLT